MLKILVLKNFKKCVTNFSVKKCQKSVLKHSGLKNFSVQNISVKNNPSSV